MPTVFHRWTNGQVSDQSDINQFVDDLEGASGEGKPHNHVSVNTTGWASRQRNLDASNGQVEDWRRYDDNQIVAITKDGFRYNKDGSAALATLTPVGTTGDEEIAGVKTFQAPAGKRGSNVASAASVALPANAEVVPITGNTTITAFTGLVAGRRWTLEFQSADCQVTAGAAIRIDGNYVSSQYGTLRFYTDGTNVYEVSRVGKRLGCRLYRTSNQTISSDFTADTAISWQAADWNVGTLWVIGTPTRIVPGVGKWRAFGVVVGNAISSIDVRVRLYLNGSRIRDLNTTPVGGLTGSTPALSFSTEVNLTLATDYLELTFTTDSPNQAVGSDINSTELIVERASA